MIHLKKWKHTNDSNENNMSYNEFVENYLQHM